MVETIPRETKKGTSKKGQKTHSPKGPKRERASLSFMVRSYLTHMPSNVMNMQIMKSNNNGRSRTRIAYQSNLFFKSRD